MTDKLRELTKNMNKADLIYHVNYKMIPKTELEPSDENMELFNTILREIRAGEYNPIVRTKSGGISIALPQYHLPAYDIQVGKYSAEITLLDMDGMFRIIFGNFKSKDDDEISGWKAFNKLKIELEKDGINLDDYAVDNGEEIKKEIKKPLIDLVSPAFADIIFENAFHIDYHSSYPAGLANTHPEFRTTMERLYNNRKKNATYKAILNYSIGYMQSKYTKYQYATLARDALNDNYDRIQNMTQVLRDNGCMILARNTDGIWAIGEPYHGDGEGTKLGEWSVDHQGCTIRFRSGGAYEFIENGEYTPVLRGQTRLDSVKDRSQWQWGDIYNPEALDTIIYKPSTDGIYKA